MAHSFFRFSQITRRLQKKATRGQYIDCI